MSQDLDKHSIERIKEGDAYAFRLMVEKYKDVSLSLVCSIVKDEQLAEDILQDVFIRVFEKVHTFKFKSSFSTWLYRIAVNMSYTALKSRKHSMDINTLEETSEIRVNTKELMKEAYQKKFIHLALKALNADEALVLQLFYLSEKSMKEIVKITGFTLSKVKISLHRGRGNLDFQLRQLLGNEIENLL
ncbi:RNA polymerase sigma factor [Spongiimicrobium salis]|uniref:RNA polymerase sigma factor n=1 Tax=Spongiimicrobium salis TaxID=1667022 RepID=UPI00374CDABD